MEVSVSSAPAAGSLEHQFSLCGSRLFASESLGSLFQFSFSTLTADRRKANIWEWDWRSLKLKEIPSITLTDIGVQGGPERAYVNPVSVTSASPGAGQKQSAQNSGEASLSCKVPAVHQGSRMAHNCSVCHLISYNNYLPARGFLEVLGQVRVDAERSQWPRGQTDIP